MTEDPDPDVLPLLARATVNLSGFAAGTIRWVDANSPYVQDCLEILYLVPVETSSDDPSG